MVLKTCKWYQTVCLIMTRRLIFSLTFLGQSLKLAYLGHNSILFVMSYGDLNIDLTQKSYLKRCRSFNELSNAICRLPLRLVVFDISEVGRKGPRSIQSLSEPARNRVKIWYDIEILVLVLTKCKFYHREYCTN